ncbi:Transcriptional regulator BlaI [compost metagenome]
MTHELEGGAFHPGRVGLKKLLGELEAEIMQVVWSRPEAMITVRDVHDVLGANRKLAYTTVMTVMGNLAKKGLLAVEQTGKAYAYRATQTYEQFTETAVTRIVNELLKDFTDPAIACFTRAIGQKNT